MEEEELMEEWKKLWLSKEEEKTRIEFDPQLESLITNQMKHCLVGKLLSSRSIAPGIIKNTFASAWRTSLSFNVENLGRNLFLFKFDSRRDKEMVLRLGPWLFDNSLLALEDPKRNIKLSHLSFNKVAFWVRLMDIPLNFQNKYMAKRIGDALGRFLDVDCDQDNFCWGECLRIKIMIDISKPLRRGIWIEPGGEQDSIWIQIKYERLPDFCYGCGHIGHVVKECRLEQVVIEGEENGWQFGNWLRVEGPNSRRKRRTSSTKEEKENSPSESATTKKGVQSKPAGEPDFSDLHAERNKDAEVEVLSNPIIGQQNTSLDLNFDPIDSSTVRIAEGSNQFHQEVQQLNSESGHQRPTIISDPAAVESNVTSDPTLKK